MPVPSLKTKEFLCDDQFDPYEHEDQQSISNRIADRLNDLLFLFNLLDAAFERTRDNIPPNNGQITENTDESRIINDSESPDSYFGTGREDSQISLNTTEFLSDDHIQANNNDWENNIADSNNSFTFENLEEDNHRHSIPLLLLNQRLPQGRYATQVEQNRRETREGPRNEIHSMSVRAQA